MIEPSLSKWALEKIKIHDEVSSVDINEDEVIIIKRINGSFIRVGSFSFAELNLENINKIVEKYRLDFILNIKSGAIYKGEIYSFLDDCKISFGSLSDLYRVISQSENWPYLHRDVKFILRGLEQHSKVVKVVRLDNKRLKIFKRDLQFIVIVATNDYEVNAESIRKLQDDFNSFDAILASNPSGRITSQAYTVASMLNVPLYNWSELYVELNKS
ncbi:conserved hypothetical protein [Flavobacterium sp. 9R]|uniref:hypothetical protein n=1 Tax=Flavobacterium sp. 9R TaxID=2653143 RepID=UPI0012F25478|nr:hypothetical protein [Flavobacterium sp. 9R]VXB57973.1 conserved hypothetical protein [Flavobacterium sp. 9R]